MAVKDLDENVRGLSSKAFARISNKHPSLSNFILNKLRITLVKEETISLERIGNA